MGAFDCVDTPVEPKVDLALARSGAFGGEVEGCLKLWVDVTVPWC